MTTDWIEHDGKSIPVDADTLVYVKFRDGKSSVNPDPVMASWWHGSGGVASCWLHNDHNCNADIVAYRVVKS